MADEKQKPAEPKDDLFTKDERAYFDSRGEKDIPAPAGAAAAEQPVVTSKEPPAAPPTPADKPDAQTTVPQSALHEERKRRQEADERARQLELLNARMEERFRAFRDAVAPQQRQPQGPPAVDQDIFGAVKHMQQEQARTRTEIDNYKRAIQQEDYAKQLKDWGSNAEAAFVRNNPDYYEALKHLREARARELQIWGMSPSAIGDQLKHEENQLLARAAAERYNPAEKAYALAQSRGYQKGAAPAQPTNGTAKQEVDLNRIEAGQKQSGSLSAVGGGAGGRDVGDIEIEDLLKMNDREFGAFIEKYPARFRRLKGAAH